MCSWEAKLSLSQISLECGQSRKQWRISSSTLEHLEQPGLLSSSCFFFFYEASLLGGRRWEGVMQHQPKKEIRFFRCWDLPQPLSSLTITPCSRTLLRLCFCCFSVPNPAILQVILGSVEGTVTFEIN